MESGEFRDHNIGIKMPIYEAISKGLIKASQTKMYKKPEHITTVSLLKITQTQEKYSVIGIKDPKSKRNITVDEAISRGIFNLDSAVYKDDMTQEEFGIEDAIDRELVQVEVEEEETLVSSKHYIISSVTDTRTKQRMSLEDAIDESLLLEDSDRFIDRKHEAEMTIDSAIEVGYMEGRELSESDVKLWRDPKKSTEEILSRLTL